ncbi:hypothetical protein [Rhizobium sp. S163]|uniref:hypothetical protein n=1 Tax=Rhizobium sp. S163 TaxID=3055039 RepID=UPI0025A95FC8|nr:hypothetical protein [Rhizobium sp. S163]MDM9644381.1 hypothetical protein [Rhizobium sp. S163]
MKAQAIRRYQCVCEECDPLPPIEGLAAPTDAEERKSGTGVLSKLAARLALNTPERQT